MWLKTKAGSQRRPRVASADAPALDVVARERVFASVTAEQNLIDLYVPPPTNSSLRSVTSAPSPDDACAGHRDAAAVLQTIDPTGAGKTNMILRVLANLGQRVLVVKVGDDPATAAVTAGHTRVGHGICSRCSIASPSAWWVDPSDRAFAHVPSGSRRPALSGRTVQLGSDTAHPPRVQWICNREAAIRPADSAVTSVYAMVTDVRQGGWCGIATADRPDDGDVWRRGRRDGPAPRSS